MSAPNTNSQLRKGKDLPGRKADPVLMEDLLRWSEERGGYLYVTSWNSFVPKQGKMNGFLMYSEVARCAIADKMAPGKWFKFRDGTWTEPGLGGKASRVGFSRRGLYGNTIYSTHLKTYLRIGIDQGVRV